MAKKNKELEEEKKSKKKGKKKSKNKSSKKKLKKEKKDKKEEKRRREIKEEFESGEYDNDDRCLKLPINAETPITEIKELKVNLRNTIAEQGFEDFYVEDSLLCDKEGTFVTIVMAHEQDRDECLDILNAIFEE